MAVNRTPKPKFNKSKLHLIPDMLLSLSGSLFGDNKDVALNTLVRLEAIRDYCDSLISDYETHLNWTDKNRFRK